MGKHYIPNSAHKDEMLKEIGFSSIEDLFSDVPKGMVKEFNLPEGKSEYEVFTELNETLSKNKTVLEMPSFLGAGTYFHYVPAHVKYLIERSEFLTAYTPYQPEISQGMLQALFEYQSLIAELVGLPIVNSSMYDWGTAMAEAALMSARVTKRNKFVVPKHLSPEKKLVLKTYTAGPGLETVEVPWDERGQMDIEKLKEAVEGAAGVYIEMPNFFGLLEENIREIGEIAHDAGALFVVGVDPTILGIVEAPGELGADIVVGEAAYFGNPMNFGGPRAGIFAVRNDRKLIRQMPGRIIGMTKDADGKRAFVMTLQTREQHIRRAKATSNICSNEALVAVAAAIHLATLGPKGVRELGEVILKNTAYLKKRLAEVGEIVFDGVNFKDVPVRFEVPYSVIHERLLERNIHGGYYIGKHFQELGETALFAATETTRKEWVDGLVDALREIIGEAEL
ncbi:glycine cleavage system protein P, subunit 1 [Thermococcus kodakarensis KOD1]|uniref:Probable glycine dehydrogenase (decarboxylating) subunit 1 n=1 Tax=Thermococcus kodakarensis (strain ATCC BAA-918 / JCM 12380 / KOD1) TaxID=69014 RepID=GCSPA_THEKO|nr:aminomethyl-transferring glycine dehydrogenase subunit GcvPA [Thermococcus kodakarensis]Q5JGX5.1 RecName: Full=Probable glycine dehydrogenase (decarboxylating) subunit 1; AltName: Full=Glycine cleavage system P-protein subunit 1; AltName: Full=Glycine decarboxylase subunit 1; AltName: Full=Glycine dehydrogenase (aminomethyl-transferring) subunit 1 [Thermococcus kodakarensis KOD1]WCN27357.1 aminomethyl-transferring glycine dehydrogenase subunit GcvPA [Thermococcus kodakarensis]WCN29646.1 amino